MSEWIITSSVLILLIMGIRACFRNKIALWARYALWLVVAVRLLVPVTFSESVFSVLNFLEWAEEGAAQIRDSGTEDSWEEAADGNSGKEVGGTVVAEGGSLSGSERDAADIGNAYGSEKDTAVNGNLSGSGKDAETGGGSHYGSEADSSAGTGNGLGRDIEKGAGNLYGSGTVSAEDTEIMNGSGKENAATNGNSYGTRITVGDLTNLGDSVSMGSVDTRKDSVALPETEVGLDMDGPGRERLHFAGKILLFCIWILGAAAVAGSVLSVNGRYRRKVYATRKRCRTAAKSGLPVYFSSAVATPCMFGLLHPAVYLTPGIERNEKALKYVLCHENTHYRHRDNLWAVVRVACICLHWYNPLVWIAAELSRQDCELACDERTLKLLDEEDRIDYGRTLLDFSVQSDVLPGGLQLSTAVSGGKKQLKERLMMIVGRPRRTISSLALTMVLVLLVSAVTFTGKVSGQELPSAFNDRTVESGKKLVYDYGTAGKGSGENAGQTAGAGETGQSSAAGDTSQGNTAGNAAESSVLAKRTDPVSNTSIVSIDLKDGKDYILKIVGENEGSEDFQVRQMELNRIHGRIEDTVQTIHLEEVKVLYTRSLEEVRAGDGQMWLYTPEEEVLYAKPLCMLEDVPAYAASGFQARDREETLSELFTGGIYVADLNFDGYQDFYLQGRRTGRNTPFYCYLWNPAEGKYEPGYMIPNLYVDKEAQQIVSTTDDGENVSSEKIYRFDENGFLHMCSYYEENQSPDALFPTLNLEYCETAYSLPAVDEWDYGTRYGGALTERLVNMAKDALTELYEWSGTKLDSVCFSVTSFGDLYFGNTMADVKASRTFYDRCYGAEAGFEDCIRHMSLNTEREVWFSPVVQWNVPENQARMTDEEIVLWYFERSAIAKGEAAESIEQRYTDTYLIRTESGNYYEVGFPPTIQQVNSVYGPYDSYPNH